MKSICMYMLSENHLLRANRGPLLKENHLPLQQRCILKTLLKQRCMTYLVFGNFCAVQLTSKECVLECRWLSVIQNCKHKHAFVLFFLQCSNCLSVTRYDNLFHKLFDIHITWSHLCNAWETCAINLTPQPKKRL